MTTQPIKALHLYRQILRAAKTFPSPADRSYILHETPRLFRANASLTSPAAISARLFEAESRLALGLHYGIPYPRPSNVSPGETGQTRGAERIAYMASYGGVG
eukprot:CAMPEP_0184709470 /NCGR_PEP_ID=MMETSP0314-20130426/609_1 /TAXON_ID=38298 /ORGANISM="Rhodella maculata, Strain CCMP 736" /LENGTH=102 /DNA_ID=CAMNT_0027171179 /DNA_START=28 /DNA_END=333 /DNA_ORIENTATION=+